MFKKGRILIVVLTIAMLLSMLGGSVALAEEPVVSPPVSQTNDALMELLPAETLFCVRINKLDSSLFAVRINKLDSSLFAMDEYFTGIAPMPMAVTMFVRAQLAGMLGSPMLSGVNTNGDFAILTMAQRQPGVAGNPVSNPTMPEMLAAMLVPITSYAEFTAGNPNCSTADADGISIISAQTSSLGKLAVAEVTQSKFALLTLAERKADLVKIKKAMAGSSLKTVLDSSGQKLAISEPVWGYGNVELLVNIFEPMITSGIDKIKKTIPQETNKSGLGANPEKIISAYFDMVIGLLKQIKYVDMQLKPTAQTLAMSFGVTATPSSKLAELLAGNKNRKPFPLAGYLGSDDAINAVARYDKIQMAKMNDIVFDMLFSAMAETMPPETMDKFKTYAQEYTKAMGGEMAVSFSYAGGMPPMKLREVIAVEDSEAVNELTEKYMETVNELYKGMGLEMSLVAAPKDEMYKEVAIKTYEINLPEPLMTDPNCGQAFPEMFDMDMKFYMATTEKLMLFTMGAAGDKDIRGLIDQVKSGATPQASGDLKIAMGLIENADKADVVASVNILKLCSGVGEMLKSMPMGGSNAGMIAMFEQLNMPTKSCIAVAGYVDNGRASEDIIIPKDHLLEVMGAFMQIQQQMMMQQMQQQQQMAEPNVSEKPAETK